MCSHIRSFRRLLSCMLKVNLLVRNWKILSRVRVERRRNLTNADKCMKRPIFNIVVVCSLADEIWQNFKVLRWVEIILGLKTTSRNLLLGEISSNGDKSKWNLLTRRDLHCQSRGSARKAELKDEKHHLKVIKMRKGARYLWSASLDMFLVARSELKNLERGICGKHLFANQSHLAFRAVLMTDLLSSPTRAWCWRNKLQFLTRFEIRARIIN